MTQISRPLQIALAALVLFIAVWFVALRGHSGGESTSASSSSSAPSTASSSPSSPSASQSAPGGGTPASKGGVYHGSAPGVEGLSRAIQKARGAVAQSQQNAKQQGSAQASSGAQKQSTQSTQGQSAQHSTQGRTSHSKSATQTAAQQRQSQQAQGSHTSKAAGGVPAMQAVVEGELKRGEIVAVLFWNPKGAVDATVRRELRAAGSAQHGRLAVHVARANQVGSFGSFTHAVQVYSTPTILLINTKGKTSSLTGLTDAFSIGQAVKEVKRAK
jgi:hypothetical protein